MSDNDALEGRMYIDYRRHIRPYAREYYCTDRMAYVYRDEDVTEVRTPHIIPNGKWVMERPSGWAWLTGIEKTEVLSYTDKHGGRCDLRISDKPFGYIVADDQDVDQTVYPRVVKPTGSKMLLCARQIHKGELGQTVPIPRLKLGRQAPDLSSKRHDFSRNRDQKRNHVRWARLADLMSAAGLGAHDVLFGYWQFLGWSYDPALQRHGTLLHAMMAVSAAEIRTGDTRVLFLDEQEALQMLSGPLKNVWIRAGFAKTVLRLTALGVRPEATQPA